MREALSKEELTRVYGRLARRYDLQHALITAASDQKGRELLVAHAVKEGDNVLDCGAGTGTMGIMAAERVGPRGKVTLFDLSDAMLAVAREKAARKGLLDRLTFQTGDITRLPFADGSFDVVLSTYSLCPLRDPAEGARELYRVTRLGGRIGIAHSTTPGNRVVKWLADRVEGLAWRFPWLSMGCRAVSVLPALKAAGARIVFSRRVGIPLWPFLVIVAEKPVPPPSNRV